MKKLFLLFLIFVVVSVSSVYAADSPNNCSSNPLNYAGYADFESGVIGNYFNVTGSLIDQQQAVFEKSWAGFSGSSGFANIRSDHTLGNNNSIQWYVKIGNATSTDGAFMQLRDGGTPILYIGNLFGSSEVNWVYYDGGGFGDTGVPMSGDWQMFKVVRNGENMDIYVDDIYTFSRPYVSATTFYANGGPDGSYWIDKIMTFPGLVCPPGIDLLPPINSSWNATGNSIFFGEDSAAWNGGGTINISSNLLSLTVTTDETSNMSCRIGFDQNYSSMTAENPLYKAATTETTSHAITVYDDLAVGDSCLYCSFIDSVGNEQKTSSSGCLKISRKNINTTIKGFDLSIHNFSVSKTTKTELIYLEFNTSYDEDTLMIAATFNTKKVLGALNSDLTVYIDVDGINVVNKLVRGVSVDSVGSSGTPPNIFKLSRGLHNITIFMSRTGNGVIKISEFDLVFINFLSASDGDLLNVSNVSVTNTFNSDSFVKVGGFGIDSEVESPYGFYGVWSIYSGTPGTDAFFYLNDSYSDSGFAGATMNGYRTVSVAGIFGEQLGVTQKNLSVYGSSSSETIIDGGFVSFDLKDSAGHLINYFYDSTNAGVLGEGKHLLLSKSANNNESFIVFSSILVEDLLGSDHDVQLILEDGHSVTTKFRTVTDFGFANIFANHIFNESGLHNYNLSVNVGVGGAIKINSSSMMGLSGVGIDSVIIPSAAPISGYIISPSNDEEVFGEDTILWSSFFDVNDDIVNYSVLLYNFNGSLNVSINVTDAETVSQIVNWNNYDPATYTLFVVATDLTGFTANTSINFTVLDYYLNTTLISPVGGYNLSSMPFDFVFSVTNSSNCSIILNSSSIINVSAGVGVNSVEWTLLNGSYGWSVSCFGASTPSTENFNVYIVEVLGETFSVGSCPIDSTAESIIFGFMIIICLFFLSVSFIYKAAFMGFFGSLMLLVTSWYIAGCAAVFAGLIIGISVFLIGYFVVSGLDVGKI